MIIYANINTSMIMCHNVNKKCIMCTKMMGFDLSLCADGMTGNICVITPMNELSVDVEISHPRVGSRTYINVRPYIVTVTQVDICNDCMMMMTEDTDVSRDELDSLFKELKTKPLSVDAEHINSLITMRMKKRLGRHDLK